MNDFFNARDVLRVGEREYGIYRLDALEKAGLTDLKRLPFSIRIVLEAALRQCDSKLVEPHDVIGSKGVKCDGQFKRQSQ